MTTREELIRACREAADYCAAIAYGGLRGGRVMWMCFFFAAANVVLAVMNTNLVVVLLNMFSAGWCAAFGVAIATERRISSEDRP